MARDIKTLAGQVARILETNPNLSGDALVVAVWWNYHWAKMVDDPYAPLPDFRDVRITPHQAAKLPGPERILAVARRLAKRNAPTSAEHVPPHWVRD